MPILPSPLPQDMSVYEVFADVDAYAATYGHAKWLEADAEKQSVCKAKAAGLLNGFLYKGAKADKEQRDAFPRVGLADNEGHSWGDNEIPLGVISAFCELSVMFLAVLDEEIADPLAPVSERERVETSETIGPLSFSYGNEFKSPLARESVTGFPVVDGMLAGLLRNGSKYGSIEMRRG